MTKKKRSKDNDLSSTGFLNIPPEVLGTIAAYASVGDITNVLSTNRELYSRMDYTMSSIFKGMKRKDAFEKFSNMVVGGSTKAVEWFRFKDPSDGHYDNNDDDNDTLFLERTLNEKDEFSRKIGAALHVAAYYGHRALVEKILTMGFPVMAKGFYGGWTALHIAAAKGQKEAVETLLERGADITYKCNNGGTALHIAARKGQYEIVEVLLDSGADIEAKDDYGETSFHWAIGLGRMEMATLLWNRGAKEKD